MSQRTYWDEPRPTVFLCAECSERVPHPEEVATDSHCANCGADLHCCRNCSFFDPSAENECRQPVPERIAKKRRNNDCAWFRPVQVVDLMGGGRTVPSAEQAHRDFDDLFK